LGFFFGLSCVGNFFLKSGHFPSQGIKMVFDSRIYNFLPNPFHLAEFINLPDNAPVSFLSRSNFAISEKFLKVKSFLIVYR